MHRDWKHDVSESWLLARRPYLTASDIKNLLADYKRIKAGKIRLMQAQQFAKVFGSKQMREVDTSSFGAMARGHIMEPYAIDDYNAWRRKDFKWWDDKIIVKGSLGFSPDALDIPRIKGVRFVTDDGWTIRHKGGEARGPEELLEIKSYEAGAHYQRKVAVSFGEKIDERWQVACGMAVCDSVKQGTICFYAPQCDDMFDVAYTRMDLEEELSTIDEIKEMWDEFCVKANSIQSRGTGKTEAEIYDLYLLDNMTD